MRYNVYVSIFYYLFIYFYLFIVMGKIIKKVCFACGGDREKGTRWKFIEIPKRKDGELVWEKLLFCDKSCKNYGKEKIKKEREKKAKEFLLNLIATAKKTATCENAVKVFFEIRKHLKKELPYWAVISLKNVFRFLLKGELKIKSENLDLEFDRPELANPWIIPAIEQSKCDHKWCGILKQKLAEKF